MEVYSFTREVPEEFKEKEMGPIQYVVLPPLRTPLPLCRLDYCTRNGKVFH